MLDSTNMETNNKNISIDTKADGIELVTNYKYPIWLKPKPTEDLVRIGHYGDGGYVLPYSIIKASNMLMTFGLGYEFSFEQDYHKHTKNKIICYDGTVSKSGLSLLCRRRFLSSIFQPHKPHKFMYSLQLIKKYFTFSKFFNKDEIQFIQKNIRNGSLPGTVSYNECVKEMYNLTLLKIDIEADEYQFLDDIVATKSKLCGLIIEFHDTDLNLNIIKAFLNNMEGFTLVHIHANALPKRVGACPLFTEMTIVNNAYCSFTNKEYSYPVKGLDWPDSNMSPDYKLQFE